MEESLEKALLSVGKNAFYVLLCGIVGLKAGLPAIWEALLIGWIDSCFLSI
jgi:hypothetical protein